MKGAKENDLSSLSVGTGVTEIHVFHCSSAGTNYFLKLKVKKKKNTANGKRFLQIHELSS